MADETQEANAYKIVWSVLEGVRSASSLLAGPLWISFDAMRAMGITFANHDNQLFTQDLANLLLDCDTASDVLLAIANELNLPVYMVSAPEHFFTRYVDDDVRLNFDLGHVTDGTRKTWAAARFRITV